VSVSVDRVIGVLQQRILELERLRRDLEETSARKGWEKNQQMFALFCENRALVEANHRLSQDLIRVGRVADREMARVQNLSEAVRTLGERCQLLEREYDRVAFALGASDRALILERARTERLRATVRLQIVQRDRAREEQDALFELCLEQAQTSGRWLTACAGVVMMLAIVVGVAIGGWCGGYIGMWSGAAFLAGPLFFHHQGLESARQLQQNLGSI
jgi:hypothetical protein